MEARVNMLTALCDYQFQTRAVPRLEPTTGTCDELAITGLTNDISIENAKVIDYLSQTTSLSGGLGMRLGIQCSRMQLISTLPYGFRLFCHHHAFIGH